MMKGYLILAFIFFSCLPLAAQQAYTYLEGSVSFLSSQHIYVKFASTESIQVGDTLFVKQAEVLVPCVTVKNKSTTSCVSVLIPGGVRPVVAEILFARIPLKKKQEKTDNAPVAQVPVNANPDPVSFPGPPKVDRSEVAQTVKQDMRGRISASSYSNLSASESVHQMRYTLSLQGNHLNNSRFSVDNYLTFRHTLGEWGEVKSALSNAFKVYALSVKYDMDSTSSIALGRKINQKISSMGAIDGLQFEKNFGNLQTGAILGSRPDYSNYGLNLNLVQAGAFVSYGVDTGRYAHQSTFAVVEQRNHSKTDRRFAYFQHSAALGRIFHIFTSFEMDLFSNVNENPKSTLSLTNTLVSLQANLSKKWSLSGAYDNRKNVIYYESYKNFIDRLIEDETRQGLRVSANYRPFKTISWGINASWRFQKSQINVSRNINSYLNFNRIPVLNMSAALSANLLQTAFLDSKMFGVRLSKEIISGSVYADIYARYVQYTYTNYENQVNQYIAGADFSFNLTRSLAVHAYYEGTFDQTTNTLNRLHTKIIKRF